MPVVRSIVREAARNDYRFSAVVLGIVKNSAFQMNRALSLRERDGAKRQGEGRPGKE